MITDFDEYGNLPEGIHEVQWDEFCERFGTNLYRKRLIRGMKEALDNLKHAGCRRVYIDGSFVTSKYRPNDYDACWEPDEVNPQLLDSVLLDFRNGRTAQKMKYLGELFLSSDSTSDTGETFLDFFQNDPENNEKKGIIAINLEDLP